MSDSKYIVAPKDATMPFGQQQAERVSEVLDNFLAGRLGRILTLPEAVDVYHFENEVMRKVDSHGLTPCLVDDVTMFVPVSESSGDYQYEGFELWKKIDGQWQRPEREAVVKA